MTCTHLNGGLHILIHRRGAWFSHCLCCGADLPQQDVTLPVEAGQLASHAAQEMADRHFASAAQEFALAAEKGGDPRYHMAALLCELGVSWCGDEYQPTLHASLPTHTPLESTPQWQALSRQADTLFPYVWQGLNALRTDLEAILTPLRKNEGVSACDVFLCYRRTPGNVMNALQLHHDLRKMGLRVFCADVTTRGKPQPAFEAEVCHALHTAEYLVIFPGDGEDAISPWMRNELERASCPAENRFVCTDDRAGIPEGLGTALSMMEITLQLTRSVADCTADRLWERGVAALKDDAAADAVALLCRASAREHPAARLLLATLFDEGLLLPADPLRASHYRRLAGKADERCRRLVHTTLDAVEKALGIIRRQAVLYVAADVSDAGIGASRELLTRLLTAVQAERRLASSELCLVGYDLHARIIEAPKVLDRYGLPESAAGRLHTRSGSGCDQHAFAAKGLRLCAADYLSRPRQEECQPLLVLLSPGVGSDAPDAVPAALESVRSVFPNAHEALLTSVPQIPACIAALLDALR